MEKQKKWVTLPLHKSSEFMIFCVIVSLLCMGAIILATILGSVHIQVPWVAKIIVNHITRKEIYPSEWNPNVDSIIWSIRMPRVIMAFFTGAGLSLCGILMQALTKNSLADPYVLGISSGASTGAVSVICFGILSFAGPYRIMLGAMIGAVVSITIAMKFASIQNRINPTRLILSGIAVQSIFSAATNTMIFHTITSSDKMRVAMHWMIGSLSNAKWETNLYIILVSLICFTFILLLHQGLDILMLGDDAAITIGVNVRKIKLSVIVFCTILTGAIVSSTGVIGFVGLIVPHITRGFVGSMHKRLIPASFLTGGLFVIICDMLSRTIVAPEELPLGVVTAFFGAPFFLYLIRQDGRKGR